MTHACDKRVIARNAGSNVLRGASSALVTLSLPPLLTRCMSPESYGAWALVLQLSGGVQIDVLRFTWTSLVVPVACALPMILAAAFQPTMVAVLGWAATLVCALSWVV